MTAPNACRHLAIIPFADPFADVTCPDCQRRYFRNDEGLLVWSDPGEPGYDMPHHAPKMLTLPDGYDMHLASMGVSISIDPLLPPGTFILMAHGLGPRFFDANTGEELTREQFMALPCGFEGWRFDSNARMELTVDRPKDL